MFPVCTLAQGPAVAPTQPRTSPVEEPDLEPPYHVVLHDDDKHTYAYVIEMLHAIFGHPFEVGFRMADEVNTHGRVVVATVHKELAELRLEQIHDYGPDPRSSDSKNSMRATIEPAH